jgi:TRAP-type C4-dicarboxylate transport system permease small subunit
MHHTLIRSLDVILKSLAAVAAAGLTVCVLLGIASRAVNDPFGWTEELSRFFMVWVAMLGWVLASRRRAHIRIRFFHDLLPRFWWAMAEIFMQLGVVLFGLIVVVAAAELIERNSDVEATSVPLAMMWIYVPLALAAAVATLQALADIARAWQARHASAGEALP